MIRTFKIKYLQPQTWEEKSFIVTGEDIDTIRIKTINKLKKIGVNTDLNEWEVEEITKSKNIEKYFLTEN
jgi:hypothetical protein